VGSVHRAMTSEQQRPAPEEVRLQKEAFARGHQFFGAPV
jgi:hypothetical protein